MNRPALRREPVSAPCGSRLRNRDFLYSAPGPSDVLVQRCCTHTLQTGKGVREKMTNQSHPECHEFTESSPGPNRSSGGSTESSTETASFLDNSNSFLCSHAPFALIIKSLDSHSQATFGQPEIGVMLAALECRPVRHRALLGMHAA